ncbi:Fic family protein [Nocardia sp. NPDC059177]|uniref:Fic family protein n=1 Tax=Nocardia sp. NPDC059177 TaxID=3346759 RepID=UPI0036974B61
MTGRRDGLRHRIDTVERARNPWRAARLGEAYELLRADAAGSRALDFELLATWQCIVLGVDRAPFRDGPAFAKQGREHYGLDAQTPAHFAKCLADSRTPDLPVAARAARLYLDVGFFHPFTDGNARAALLALTFVLARAGIVLDEVGPIAQVHRFADDLEGALGLVTLITALIAGTHRRSAGPSYAGVIARSVGRR